MATKKPRSKPLKAAPSVRTSARKNTAKASQRARKAAPGGIKADPKIEGVKRAIHEALGRDLADLLSSVGSRGSAGVHAWVPVETSGSDYVLACGASEPRTPPPMSPIQSALLDLGIAIDGMMAVGEEETDALRGVLGQPVPTVGNEAGPSGPAATCSELAARIASAAQAIADNTRMRRDRLSRIEL